MNLKRLALACFLLGASLWVPLLGLWAGSACGDQSLVILVGKIGAILGAVGSVWGVMARPGSLLSSLLLIHATLQAAGATELLPIPVVLGLTPVVLWVIHRVASHDIGRPQLADGCLERIFAFVLFRGCFVLYVLGILVGFLIDPTGFLADHTAAVAGHPLLWLLVASLYAEMLFRLPVLGISIREVQNPIKAPEAESVRVVVTAKVPETPHSNHDWSED